MNQSSAFSLSYLFCLSLTFNLLLTSVFFSLILKPHPVTEKENLSSLPIPQTSAHVLLCFSLRSFLREWWAHADLMAVLPSHSSIHLLQAGFVLPRLRILSRPWHQTYGFWRFFPVWFPLHQPHLTPSYLSGHFSLSGLGSLSSAPSCCCVHVPCLTPVLTSVLLRSSPWPGSSLYPELFLTSCYPTAIPQKLTLSLVPPELHFHTSTCGPKLPNLSKRVSFRHLETSRTGLTSPQTCSSHIHCPTDCITILQVAQPKTSGLSSASGCLLYPIYHKMNGSNS